LGKEAVSMAVSELINLSALLDDAKCFDLVRQHRWPLGVRCPVAIARRLSAMAVTRPNPSAALSLQGLSWKV